MGTKPRHRCLVCNGQDIAVRYKPARRKRGQRYFKWFCSRCEEQFLEHYSPDHISEEQRRRYIGAKYGYKIQEKEEVMRNVQTLENGLDGQEKVSGARLV